LRIFRFLCVLCVLLRQFSLALGFNLLLATPAVLA
jgi:hypothetical protein